MGNLAADFHMSRTIHAAGTSVNLFVRHYTREQRSSLMARIRSRDTAPERKVRSVLHRSGYRFRLHRKDLPGCPDIVLSRHCVALFVHGCFWHSHNCCKRARTPKSNKPYWSAKLQANIARDRAHEIQLRRLGWRVAVIWECQATDETRLRRRLEKLIHFPPTSTHGRKAAKRAVSRQSN